MKGKIYYVTKNSIMWVNHVISIAKLNVLFLMQPIIVEMMYCTDRVWIVGGKRGVGHMAYPMAYPMAYLKVENVADLHFS